MLQSMTGFGKAELEMDNKKITIEIKSLNSKQLDLFVRTPPVYREKEIELRNIVSQQLIRGKIEVGIQIESESNSKNAKINHSVIKDYFDQIKELESVIGKIPSDQILPLIMKFPDTLKQEKEELDESEWKKIEDAFHKALEQLLMFRKQEGEALQKDIIERVDNISKLLIKIDEFEPSRLERIKNRIKGNLNDFFDVEEFDKNRFEQEMIFYLEKFDITEEKVRLENHCTYFNECVNTQDNIGKKLGFISQEMGREINTLGSKANDSDIQKVVVQMKDELEKIKEQLLNVL